MLRRGTITVTEKNFLALFGELESQRSVKIFRVVSTMMMACVVMNKKTLSLHGQVNAKNFRKQDNLIYRKIVDRFESLLKKLYKEEKNSHASCNAFVC